MSPPAEAGWHGANWPPCCSNVPQLQRRKACDAPNARSVSAAQLAGYRPSMRRRGGCVRRYRRRPGQGTAVFYVKICGSENERNAVNLNKIKRQRVLTCCLRNVTNLRKPGYRWVKEEINWLFAFLSWLRKCHYWSALHELLMGCCFVTDETWKSFFKVSCCWREPVRGSNGCRSSGRPTERHPQSCIYCLFEQLKLHVASCSDICTKLQQTVSRFRRREAFICVYHSDI